MDKDTIKMTLAGYLPELYEENDPVIAEALRLARQDPELSKWLDNEIAFDRTFAETIRKTPVPEGAKEALLGSYTEKDKVIRPSFWKRRTTILGIAAALCLCGALVKHFAFPPPVVFPQTASKTINTLRNDMAYFANERFVLNRFTKSLTIAQKFLSEKGYPVYDEVPSTILAFKGMGCKALDWGNDKVGLVCFKNDEGDIVHLFVVDRDVIADHARPATPAEQLVVTRGLETGGWVTNDHVFMLVGSEPEVSIPPIQ